jgi:hypothetical protein
VLRLDGVHGRGVPVTPRQESSDAPLRPGMKERVTGTLMRLRAKDAIQMGVVCHDFPYWGLAAPSFRANLAWVHCKRFPAPGLRRLFSQSVVWTSSEDGNPWASHTWLAERAGTSVVCFDGHPPRRSHGVWGLDGLATVVCRNGQECDYVADGWRKAVWSVDHATLGGVTAGFFRVCVFQRDSSPELVAPPIVGVRQDSYSIIAKKESGKPVLPPPLASRISLLPPGEHHALLILPSYLSRTKWVERRLTPGELALAWDFPVAASTALGARGLTAVCNHIYCPYKVRAWVGNGLAPAYVASTPLPLASPALIGDRGGDA